MNNDHPSLVEGFFMNETTVMIFANGDLQNPGKIKQMATRAEKIIAADGGLVHIQELGLTPDLLIGDLDSVTPEQIRWAEEQGAEVRRFSPDKDETDLELALMAAAETGVRQILVVAALGGRLDQTLSNIFLLNLPVLANLDVRIDDGQQEVILVRESIDLTGQEGELVSMLPLSPIVRGITTTGLKYPLEDASMVFYHSRGISNRMTGDKARIEFQSGILICMHERKDDTK